MVIGMPIDTTDGNSRELTERVKTWIETEQLKLDQAKPQTTHAEASTNL
jgi:hypothetical protein